MPLTVSSRVLSQESRVPLRQIQTWTEAGALIPDEGTEAPGRGGSRQYPLTELTIARIIGAIGHKGMSVTEAAGIANVLRAIVRAPEVIGFKGLEEASQVRRYITATKEGSRDPMRSVVIPESLPRWGHIEPTEANLRVTDGWIKLELAKRGEADPIMFLHRGPDGTWRYQFWAVLRAPDKRGRKYRLGNALVEVRRLEPETPAQEQCDLLLDAFQMDITAYKATCPTAEARGGYVIFLRNVFKDLNSRT